MPVGFLTDEQRVLSRIRLVGCERTRFSNQPDERFCGECGAGLTKTADPKAPEIRPMAASRSGERRRSVRHNSRGMNDGGRSVMQLSSSSS